MNTKQIVLSAVSSVLMLSPLAGVVHATTVNCSSNTTTVVTSVSSNTTNSSQTVISSNYTGGNLTSGNIWGGTIRTGSAWSIANMSLTSGSNDTFIGLTGGGAKNNCVVVNTGH